MNEIVLIALKRPYTFVVLAILIALFGGLAVWRAPTDIFPAIRIPVVAVVDARNRVHLRNVTLGENLGKIVQVTDGLAATDRLINNPPAGPLEGQEVQLASARLESP